MFTLSAIHQATQAFLRHDSARELLDEDVERVVAFWRVVGVLIRKWGFIGDGTTAADLRRDYIHVHAVALHALGTVGGDLVIRYPRQWQARLRKLETLDWARSNPVWEGRAIQNGRISKTSPSLILTGNILRSHTGLELKPTEIALEETLPEAQRVAA